MTRRLSGCIEGVQQGRRSRLRPSRVCGAQTAVPGERDACLQSLKEQEWDPRRHVEKVLGDRRATSRSPAGSRARSAPTIVIRRDRDLFASGRRQDAHADGDGDIVPGAFVVHPAGELHECINDRSAPPLPRATARTCRAAIQWRATRSGRKTGAPNTSAGTAGMSPSKLERPTNAAVVAPSVRHADKGTPARRARGSSPFKEQLT
jgi:hypothetical protein